MASEPAQGARRARTAVRPADPLKPVKPDARAAGLAGAAVAPREEEPQQPEIQQAAPPAPAPKAAPVRAAAPREEIPERQSIRPPMRESDPRGAAELRAAEILEHLGGLDEGSDEFYVPLSAIPDGWTYEWKTLTVYGAQNPAYQVQLQRTGWQPVPATRHPEMMPHGWAGNTIERKGQILMERPETITNMVKEADRRRAADQVRVKVEQLSSAPQGQMPRAADADGDPRTKPQIKKSFEPMPVPQDKK